MDHKPQIFNLLSETFSNKGKMATEERLVQGAQIMLRYAAPVFFLPAALMHAGLGWQAQSSMLARVLSSAWLLMLLLHLLCCWAVTKLDMGRMREKRGLLYASAVFQIVGLGIFIHTTGGLMSPLIVFLPVLIGCYRVFLDFKLGIVITLLGLCTYLLVIGAEVFGKLTLQIYFPYVPDNYYAYPFASMAVAGSIAVTCLICFGAINYGVNQTAILHRYITESVLRRYLPPSLVERAAVGELRLDAPPERRLVTVMFVDLVGFTSISEKLGAEAVARLLNIYLTMAMKHAHHYHATVDKFVGDAVMFVFGAPDPLPADVQAERAVRMAQDILHELSTWSHEMRLSARVGINTGEVVVGNFGTPQRSDYTVIGHTVNVAARLEAACEPDCILIGPDTATHVAHLFSLQPTGKLRLKGISKELVAYFVRGEAPESQLYSHHS